MPLMAALFGPHAMSDLSPGCAPKRTSADHSELWVYAVACFRPHRIKPDRQQRGDRQHDAEREQRVMRDRRGEPDRDSRAHHLQKPTSADAAPAFSPNGDSACAVPSGLTMPMPSRNTHIAARNGRNVGLKSETSSIAMLPVAAASRPPWIERSNPKRGAILVASMPAANTIMTVPAKNRPSWIGVKCKPSINTRGAAENIANSPPMIRLTVAAGTRKRRSATRPR